MLPWESANHLETQGAPQETLEELWIRERLFFLAPKCWMTHGVTETKTHSAAKTATELQQRVSCYRPYKSDTVNEIKQIERVRKMEKAKKIYDTLTNAAPDHLLVFKCRSKVIRLGVQAKPLKRQWPSISLRIIIMERMTEGQSGLDPVRLAFSLLSQYKPSTFFYRVTAS